MGEQVDPASRGDLHENFDFGVRGHGTLEDEDAELNQWPDEAELPGFHSQSLKYWNQVRALAKSLFPIFAMALGLWVEAVL